MKKIFTIFWLFFLFSCTAYLFWQNELKYSLPTPRPTGLKQPPIGTFLNLSEIKPQHKPVMIHFFNPDCPCSRFNMSHFKSIYKKYNKEADFVIVVPTGESGYSEDKIQKKFDVQIPVLFDKNIADKCGVYSTPQAVILDNSQHLYYRGNYNKSRYCTDRKTNYAEIALDSLLHSVPQHSFDVMALKSYGCELPSCKK